MIKSFEGFFNMGRLLDSASFKDDFTRKLLSYFDEITCIETSDIDCRCACSSDTLERVAIAARLKVTHRLGVFFNVRKGRANENLICCYCTDVSVGETLLEVGACP
jgi:hypothetical protein